MSLSWGVGLGCEAHDTVYLGARLGGVMGALGAGLLAGLGLLLTSSIE